MEEQLFRACMMGTAIAESLSHMIRERALFGWITWERAGAALVFAFLCLPLFIRLDAEDLRNDEAIYSYSVDRVLETGDWLTPRAIPFDGPFLEKPPLKVWMVAGLIHLGVLPHDERGLRFLDALFGAAAFLYVYALGCMLAGPVCGVIAVLVLFLFDPLLLDHGVRSNNMDAALMLAYCAGIYHFARVEALGAGRRRTAHALAFGAYLALGFMTKFVAVAFLPLVCLLAAVWRTDGWSRLRSRWRTWIAPAVLGLAICSPWFIYAWLEHGRLLWAVMLGQHVVTRFTASLDPSHLEPWHYYVSAIWAELTRHSLHWLVAAGVVLLVARGAIGRPWLARLIALWLVVPMILISMGTSKLFHYAYPFVPAFALGTGYLVATLVALVTTAWATSRTSTAAETVDTNLSRALRIGRAVLVAGAVVAFAVACWTMLDGRFAWRIGGVRLSNADVDRPLIIGAALLWLGAAPLSMLHRWIVVPLLVLLVAPIYQGTITRLRHPDHPLRTARDCALQVQRTSADAHRGVYNAARGRASHPFFYYFRALGPWKWEDRPVPNEVRRALVEQAQPALVALEDFGTVISALEPEQVQVQQQETRGAAARASLETQAGLESRQTAVAGVLAPGGVIVVLPGPFQTCVTPIVAAGWEAIGGGVGHGGLP